MNKHRFKSRIPLVKFFCSVIILSTIFSLANAAQKNTVRSGDWSNPFVWSPSGIPAIGDDVQINRNHKVEILSGVAVVRSLNVNDNSQLQIKQGAELEINNNLTVNGALLLQQGNIIFKKSQGRFNMGQYGKFTWDPGNNTINGASLWTNSLESFHPTSTLIIKAWYDYSVPICDNMSGNFGNLTLNSAQGNQVFEWNQNNGFETHEIKGTLKIEEAWIILDESGSISNTNIGNIELDNVNSHLYFHRGTHKGQFQVTTGNVSNYYGILYGVYNGNASLQLQINGSFENHGEVSLIKNENSATSGTGNVLFNVQNDYTQLDGDFRGIFNLTNADAGVFDYHFGSLKINKGIWIGSYACHSKNLLNTLTVDNNIEIELNDPSDIFRIIGLSSIVGINNTATLKCEVGADWISSGSANAEITSCASSGNEDILIKGNLRILGSISSFNYGAPSVAHNALIHVQKDLVVSGGQLYLSRLNGNIDVSIDRALLLDGGRLIFQAGNAGASVNIGADATLLTGDIYLHKNDLQAHNSDISCTVNGLFEHSDAKLIFDDCTSSNGNKELIIKGPVFSLKGSGNISNLGSGPALIRYDRMGSTNYFNTASVEKLVNVSQQIDSACTLIVAGGVLEVCGNTQGVVNGFTINGGGILDLYLEQALANSFGVDAILKVKNNGTLKIANAHGLYNGDSNAAIDAKSGLNYHLANNSTVVYYGSKTQDVNGFSHGTAELEHHKYGILEINKSVQAIALLRSNETHVRSELNLISGALDLNNNYLSIQSSDSSAISFDQGYILSYRSRWENNSGVIWNMRSPEKYCIPFANTSGTLSPITITTRKGAGKVAVLTYASADSDNTPFPQDGPNGAIAHVNDKNGNDFSAESAVDRWVILKADGFIADVELTYLQEEETSDQTQQNTELRIRSWNGSSWSGAFGNAIYEDSQIGTVEAKNVKQFGTWLICRVPKPIDLSGISLNASISEKIVHLTWETPGVQVNNSFIVERSKNGTQYEKIGITDKLGRVQNVNSYHFKDRLPLDGISYYRVSTVDDNGTTVLSSSEKIDLGEEEFGLSAIYPMPFENNFTIDLKHDKTEDLDIRIYSLSGQIVANETCNAKKGWNSIQFRNAADLVAGNYLLVVEGKGENYTRKIVKSY